MSAVSGTSWKDGSALRNDWIGQKRQRSVELDNNPQESKRRSNPRELSHEEYTVAWICALHIERAAVEALLDDIHMPLSGGSNDTNIYTMGNIGAHNVVIACLPAGHYGTNNAATVARDIIRSFPSIEIGLMVGIGGGVPGNTDIRLGDIVVSTEVIQYDFGKTVQSGLFRRTSNPIRPPQRFMKAVAKLQSCHERNPTTIPSIISEMLQRYPRMKAYAYPTLSADLLFKSNYEHGENTADCENCDHSQLVHRHPRISTDPEIHYGVIASGNQVMKHGGTRDNLAATTNILCFEMEAAGLMDQFPCLVVRGICDYSDSHKSKEWQKYASATSAAYAKELLSVMSTSPKQSSNPTQSQNKHAALLSQERRRAVLDSLQFEQIDARRLNIKNAHAQTCKWILQEKKYVDWQDPDKLQDHRGFLWIKGKPGAGKSTLMKFIFKDAQKTLKNKKIILNFFFNARGEDLERSTAGMYRSLLGQLFEHLPNLESTLDRLVLPNWSIGQPPQWNIQILEELLEQVVQALGDASVICFIDAVDECDQQQVRDMIDFFESVCETAMRNGPGFYICFSTRHYPHITINFGLNLVLEGQEGHSQDIANYVQSKLKVGHGKLAEKIRAELQDKASGVFMWIVLVVEILNKEHDGGRIYALRQRLQEIPGDLYELFRDILGRHDRNRDELLLCLQWVLFAREPLKPEELYFAIRAGTGKNEGLEEWDTEEVCIDDIKRFIISSSKGLAEVTKAKAATVQFIHESVRDFLLEGGGIESIWPQLNNIEGQSHEKLKECCLEYCRVDVPYWDSNTRYSREESFYLAQSAVNSFPFLSYAVQNLLFHADKAGSYNILQKAFLETTFELDQWIVLYNTVEKHDSRRYGLDTRLISILAEANTPYLIKLCSSRSSCLQVTNERYGCPLLAGAVNESLEAVLEFRSALMERQLPSNDIWKIIDQDNHNGSKRAKLSRNFKFSPDRSLLSHMAEYGDPALVALLLDSVDEDLDSLDKMGRSPLIWATVQGHHAIVQIFLNSKRINPNLADRGGRTPLSWAAGEGYLEITQALLGSDEVDPNLTDQYGKTPFSWAVGEGHQRVAQELLGIEKIDVNLADNIGRTPFSWAAGNGHQTMVHILLELESIDPDLTDNIGRTPLSWAAIQGHQIIVHMLLGIERIDPNSTDQYGQTPLSWAAGEGNREVVQTLIDSERVDPNLGDRDGRTPISWAVKEEHHGTIQAFLENSRINPNLVDNAGGTLLIWAIKNEREEITRMLLNSQKVDPNLNDETQRSPLSWAATARNTEILNALLDCKTININSVDREGRTPLSWAVIKGNSANLKALLNQKPPFSQNSFQERISPLELGLNWADKYGKTPLHYAIQGRNIAGALLLLKAGRADLTLKDHEGKTPLNYAIQNRDRRMVKLISGGKLQLDTGDDVKDNFRCLQYF